MTNINDIKKAFFISDLNLNYFDKNLTKALENHNSVRMLSYGYELLRHAKNYNKMKFTFFSAAQDFILPQQIKYIAKAYYIHVELCVITLNKLNVADGM